MQYTFPKYWIKLCLSTLLFLSTGFDERKETPFTYEFLKYDILLIFTSWTNLWNSPVPSKYYILSVSLTSSFSHSLSYLLSILFSLLHSHYTVSHILTPVTVFHSSTFAHSFSFFPSLSCISPEKNTKTLFSLQIYQIILKLLKSVFNHKN